MTIPRWTSVAGGTAAVALGLGGLASGVPAAGAAPTSAAVAGITTQLNPGWGLSRLDERLLPVDQTYRMRATGAGVTAYLIDGGLDATHSEFGGRASVGVDLVGGASTLCADELGVDHGTFVAGIVGGRTTGVAKQVRLVEVRALKCGEGGGSLPEATQRALVVTAVDWVRTHAHRPAVVNMSLNFPGPFPALDAAMQRLEAAGVTAVVSAGNDDGSACHYPPANAPSAIAVAASTSHDRRWSDSASFGSNYGSCVDLFAPGRDIKSVVAGGGTYYYAGSGATSWAAPFVTGAAALYLSKHPHATPAQVRSWLLSGSTRGQIADPGYATANRLLYAFAPLG